MNQSFGEFGLPDRSLLFSHVQMQFLRLSMPFLFSSWTENIRTIFADRSPRQVRLFSIEKGFRHSEQGRSDSPVSCKARAPTREIRDEGSCCLVEHCFPEIISFVVRRPRRERSRELLLRGTSPDRATHLFAGLGGRRED